MVILDEESCWIFGVCDRGGLYGSSRSEDMIHKKIGYRSPGLRALGLNNERQVDNGRGVLFNESNE
jgi:hypothetical protein